MFYKKNFLAHILEFFVLVRMFSIIINTDLHLDIFARLNDSTSIMSMQNSGGLYNYEKINM